MATPFKRGKHSTLAFMFAGIAFPVLYQRCMWLRKRWQRPECPSRWGTTVPTSSSPSWSAARTTITSPGSAKRRSTCGRNASMKSKSLKWCMYCQLCSMGKGDSIIGVAKCRCITMLSLWCMLVYVQLLGQSASEEAAGKRSCCEQIASQTYVWYSTM